MNILQRIGKVLETGELKSLWAYDPSSAAWNFGDTWDGLRTGTQINYQVEAGDFRKNAIVMACLHWVITTFPEAPMRVQRRTGDKVETIYDHPLTNLLNKPHKYYSGRALTAATLIDYNIDGDGYWIALLNSAGRPVEIWYEPYFSIRPKGTADEFIAYYEIYRSGHWIKLDPREYVVVHFRFGIDPRNPRRGLSRLRAADLELFTDNTAAHYTATLLRNRGIPGVIIAPKGDGSIPNTEAIKNNYVSKFTGDGRGEPMVMSKATDVYKLDFSPAEMDLGALRNIPEERISALLGVPAVVAGLGTGLDSSTYSNNEQAESRAWRDNIIPTQMVIAETLQNTLLPLLGNPATEFVSFDLSQVRALHEDQNSLYERLSTAYNAGWLMLDEVRTAANWPTLDKEAGQIFKPSGGGFGFASLPQPRKELPALVLNGNGSHEGSGE